MPSSKMSTQAKQVGGESRSEDPEVDDSAAGLQHSRGRDRTNHEGEETSRHQDVSETDRENICLDKICSL